MSRARNAILSRLFAAAREAEAPPVWESRRDYDDLAAVFEENLTAVGGEVIRAASLDEAFTKLGDLLQALDAKTAVYNAEPPLDREDLPARWPGIDWFVAGKTEGDLREFCANADVGLSGAVCAFAETGSVVLTSGPLQSRAAPLLPPVHIALVPTAALVMDIFAWAAMRKGAMPSNYTFVTGPSKSADIEQTLAVGVHGPGRFIVILYA